MKRARPSLSASPKQYEKNTKAATNRDKNAAVLTSGCEDSAEKKKNRIALKDKAVVCHSLH
jgi:hypothetical protein